MIEKQNLWQKIKKPFFCLAPMSDVTDIAFREMLARYGKDRENKDSVIFWTEFVAADGLCNKFARKKLAHILEFSEKERPIIAQVFGANPENMKKACQYIASLDFDGIDINMGCPDKSVISQGAGSALIKNSKLSKEIIQAARDGIKATGKNIPVSVKTRIGFNKKEELENWISEILKTEISALTVHLRTTKEMSKVPAHWELMEKVIKLRNKISPETLIIGNGDVQNIKEAREKINKYKCDGIMIGRGVFGNPWFFSSNQNQEISLEEKLKVMLEHTEIFDKKLLQPKHKNFDVMKKHFKAYVNGFDGAKELRIKLMDTKDSKEVKKIVNSFLKQI
ncbi:MAG TPA: tRNA-dihydrouridine synthase [Candidatus Paceibacterota bacterium]|nr:tRNA-dihydrouridine synthase [Candidatus Paceibacterota bacterium]